MAKFSKLYLPAITCLICWVTAFLVKVAPGTTDVTVTLGAFSVKVPVSKPGVLIAILVVLGFISLCGYLVFGYSTLFPQYLTMNVYHDLDGIRDSLQGLEPFQVPKLVDSTNFRAYQRTYFEKLDKKISDSLGIPKFFTFGSEYISSGGKSDTVVEKAQGFQRYHVAKSEGELTHVLNPPGAPRVEFLTKNRKFDTGYDNFALKPRSLVHGVLLITKYEQILLLSKMDKGVEYQELLTAATKVTAFPWPHISNTVYLADAPEGLVPIAYAVFQ